MCQDRQQPLATPRPGAWLPYGVMVITPALFATNIIFGRFVIAETAPFTLAAIRWLMVGLIVLPYALVDLHHAKTFTARNFSRLVLLAFLGMGVCGSGVYWGLQHTSATNATLIYSAAPLLILLLESRFRGRPVSNVELMGSLVALFGVVVIIGRGKLSMIAQMQLNTGDLLIVAATFSWAVYSLIYKATDLTNIRPAAVFCMLAFLGGAINAPMALLEIIRGDAFPQGTTAWGAIGGIVLLSSLAAFTGYQFGVRALGPSLASSFMYLMTPFGVIMAVFLLGETLETFHLLGIGLVISGIALTLSRGPKRS